MSFAPVDSVVGAIRGGFPFAAVCLFVVSGEKCVQAQRGESKGGTGREELAAGVHFIF